MKANSVIARKRRRGVTRGSRSAPLCRSRPGLAGYRRARDRRSRLRRSGRRAPRRARHDGRGPRAGLGPVGRADPAGRGELPRLGCAAGAAAHRRPRPHQGRRRAGQRRAGGPARGRRPGHRRGRGRGGGGPPRRPLPGRRVPDRLRHELEHERQRGHRPPGLAAPGPRRAPQRRGQRLAVVERRVPLGHPRRRGRAGGAGAAARARVPGGVAAGQGPGVRHGGEVGAHPPYGRHPGDPRPGVRRLRGAGHRRRRDHPRDPGRSASCRSAAPRSARGSTARPASPRRSSAGWRASWSCRCPRRATTSPPTAPATRSSRCRARCARSPSPW